MRKRKAQSILEYAILITAVLLAVIYGANYIIKRQAQRSMDQSGAILDEAASRLATATGTTAPDLPTP